MEITVTHHSLNIPGGAERLCLILIEALKKEGFNVTLATVEKTQWNIVKQNFGRIILPDEENYLTNLRCSSKLTNKSVASIYFIAYILQLLSKKSKKNQSLIINTFGDVINSIADITYVHFPLRAALKMSQVPVFLSKSMWRAINPSYNLTSSLLDRVSPGTLLTNSKFMKKIIATILHRESLVVYPPVEVEKIRSQHYTSRKNGQLVATISSYTPKRHLEQVPLIAKHAKGAKFIVMGKVNEYSKPTLKALKRQIKTLGVEDRVDLLLNPKYNRLMKILSQAKVYLHVMPNDHFGISLVEAMAAGCTPVAHRSGGPWIDILNKQQGKYGFSFNFAEEAADLIKTLVRDEKLRREVALNALSRAKKFDKPVFMKRMVEVVKNATT